MRQIWLGQAAVDGLRGDAINPSAESLVGAEVIRGVSRSDIDLDSLRGAQGHEKHEYKRPFESHGYFVQEVTPSIQGVSRV